MIRIVHCQKADYHIYIGRAMPRYGLPASPLENPYRKGDAVKAFRQHFYSRPSLQDYARTHYQAHMAAEPQTPWVLGCWCKTPEAPDAPCHGDVVRDYLNGVYPQWSTPS